MIGEDRANHPHLSLRYRLKEPREKLKGNGDEVIALFTPIILDWISADFILSCDKDLLAHCNVFLPLFGSYGILLSKPGLP